MEDGYEPVFLPSRRKPSKGQVMIEYALIIALLALVCVGAIALAAPAISRFYAQVTSTLTGTIGTPAPVDPTATPTP